MNSLIVIPSRLASTRLPNKPLADIAGLPMIVQCLKRAEESKSGPVIVAAGDQEIVEAIEAHGGTAIMTDPDLPSGSDRVWAAVEAYDPDEKYDVIINVQGDLPTLDPHVIAATAEPLKNAAVDISTAVAEITEEDEKTNPNVVKAYLAFKQGSHTARALTFTRATAPFGEGPLYHHIGLYGYRRDALKQFVSMPPGLLEQREKLEQLRALEVGMRIDATLVKTVPLGVDTPEDLEKARQLLAG
ncbi:3-deoxy-manno-octulosonate cytidylyltransferase [Curvivirga aplysinae]|uniref:3-deoxy-manno-octulosonate cytidylyltransferase n=1 Tax=Curvivirga aplysinae TaxID=2529852 RepID=UPI0012BC032A|nr:3-deoxy-manno-octulosonate cytidylyltransferase [Curvivirga aplysinae]MTI10230.1 3-deoxy-manno-octulosonate cytidylyltransferase [Curvivirga aplysinae]